LLLGTREENAMNRIESIHVAPTSERRAEPGRFQTALRGAASGLARGVAATVELAAPYVPGGTVLSAAVRGVVAGGAAGGGSGAAGAVAAGASGPDDVLGATRQLQQEAQTFNLQYLQLQESMQRESREFTALSNVMKVKHDSAKAAIQNIH
jgi:hypothetical protein